MTQNITDVVSFDEPIVSVADGDPADGADFLLAPQGLANRTRYLQTLEDCDIVTSAAGTTILTASSKSIQILTGSTTQSFRLPDETTIRLGRTFRFINLSTGNLTVKDSASGTIAVVVPGTGVIGTIATLISTQTSTATGGWYYSYNKPGHLRGSALGSSDPALAGEVGEIIPQATTASIVNLVGTGFGTVANFLDTPAAFITLTPGDWMIYAACQFTLAATSAADVFGIQYSLCTSSATLFSGAGVSPSGVQIGPLINAASLPASTAGYGHYCAIPPYRAFVSSNTNLYLTGRASFAATSAAQVRGFLYAMRAR